MSAATPAEVIDFWFGDRSRPLWFARDPEFDAEIRRRFGEAHRAAMEGRLEHWRASPEGALALVILLDQFSRNLYRGTARAFAADAQARAIADAALARGFDQQLPPGRRWFLYLPFEHSESLADQERAVALFRAHAEAAGGAERERAEELLDYAQRHLEAIRRFGRFPHRNDVLGRETTPDEADYLRDPRAWF